MSEPIRFEDGDAYERGMAVWTRPAGDQFLRWLAPPPGLRWLDIGCGNGAFTERLLAQTSPAAVDGIDPSEGQIAYARTRPGAQAATFHLGDAQALPFPDAAFDAAVMALVIFFIPDPARGVREMARILRPGGTLAAYAWDIENGGFPFEPLLIELALLGYQPLRPPHPEAARRDELHRLWTEAGATDVETTTLHVRRRFPDFEAYWASSTAMGRSAAVLAAMPPDRLSTLQHRVRARLTPEPDGAVSHEARANAVRGRMPAETIR